jgi:hypothetical protein
LFYRAAKILELRTGTVFSLAEKILGIVNKKHCINIAFSRAAKNLEFTNRSNLN